MSVEKKILREEEQKPKPSNVIPMPIKPGSPILEWWKSNKDKFVNKQIASVDDLAGYLTNFYSEKQLMNMSEQEIEQILQDLLEKGQI